ncbi:hypothetical protein Syun_005630 [Stephania yunnanensis]|uniref:Uncharacterized protein n=1 Tax=Stephania yunnanensis TaxID=152371 RepID=A0AAP0L548_9MAGN
MTIIPLAFLFFLSISATTATTATSTTTATKSYPNNNTRLEQGQVLQPKSGGAAGSSGVEAVRGVIEPGEPEIPHGPSPLVPHQNLPNLVRKLVQPQKAHNQRLPTLHLFFFFIITKTTNQKPRRHRRRVVAHGVSLHRPDRREHLPHRPHRRGVLRQEVLARDRPQPPHSPASNSEFCEVRPVRSRAQERGVLDTDIRGRENAGFLQSRLWVSLLHLPVHGGVHVAVRVGGELRAAMPGGVRVPVRVAGVHEGRGMGAVEAPNGDVGVDGMISVIGHELAELSSNPLVNAWYAGEDPTAPTEIGDLCEGLYGTGEEGVYGPGDEGWEGEDL